MITVITTLYFWLIPAYPHEAILPERQRMPRAPINETSYIVPVDLTRRSKFNRITSRSSRKILAR